MTTDTRCAVHLGLDSSQMLPDGRCPLCVTPSGIDQMLISPRARPTWNSVWMKLAHNLADRSTCSRLHVGCVVVSMDNTRVLALGYNGGPRGGRNECVSDQPGQCGHLHAEINALIKLNYHECVGKKMYVTTEPCGPCAVAVVNAGISSVIYDRPYRLHEGLETLRKAGIVVERFTVL